MGVQPFLIASSLAGVLAQRLIQTLCNACKETYEPTAHEKNILGVERIPADATIFKAVGCPKCNYKGYDSRTTVSELLLMTDEIRPLILQKADSNTVKKKAVTQGMITLRQDAILKVFSGKTSIEEVVRVINDEGSDEAEEEQEIINTH
jgi:general secretion pathway protein E